MSWTEILGKICSLEESSSTGILGTDPYQIPERILGDDNQNPITEDTEETGKFDVDVPYVQSRIHSDYDSSESIADSDLEDGESTKNAGLTAVCTWANRKLWFFSETHSFRETRSKKKIQKRGASANRIQADHS